MVIVDDDHPDIMEFVTWKAKEENKVRALQNGHDTDFNGDAYSTVSGQNGNNSVRLSDDTMRKVLELDKNPDAVIQLKGRVDPSWTGTPKELWDAINQSHTAVLIRLQFHGRFNEWHTCPAGERRPGMGKA